MVGEIIVDPNAIHFAPEFQPPLHALECSERRLDNLVLDVQLFGHDNRAQGVLDVECAGHGYGEASDHRVRPSDVERHAVRGGCHVLCLPRSEEHTSELQSPCKLVCRLLLEKKKKKKYSIVLYIKKNFRLHLLIE